MPKPKSTDKPSSAKAQPKFQSLEQQNDIYRRLFSQAGMGYPEAKQLGNFKIPKLKCPKQIQTSNEKYEWARHVVDYGREPEPKMSWLPPPRMGGPPKQQQYPPQFQHVPIPPPASHFGSVSETGIDCEFSRAKRFTKTVGPVPKPSQPWTRSATHRYKDYSFGSQCAGSSSSSSVVSYASVSSTGAVGSPTSSVVGGTIHINPNILESHVQNQGRTSHSPSTSTTSVSSTDSSDTEMNFWDPRDIFLQTSPSDDGTYVEGSLEFEKVPEPEEDGTGPGALPLMQTGVPEQLSSWSEGNFKGDGNTGRCGSPMILEKPSTPKVDAVHIDDNEVLDYDYDDDDDLDVLIIGLSKKERLEVDSWDNILKERNKH